MSAGLEHKIIQWQETLLSKVASMIVSTKDILLEVNLHSHFLIIKELVLTEKPLLLTLIFLTLGSMVEV